MASWGSLNIQEQASVKAWQEQVKQLNEKAARVVKEAQEALAEFRNSAVGQIFDKVVEYSAAVITGVTKILEGMNRILETINKLMTDVMNKIKELVSGTANKQTQTVG